MQKRVSLTNKDRHLANRMPKNPTLEERIRRHQEHAKHCHCRAMPENIKKLLDTKKK